jgi:alcohol dehydrogenase class IV
VSGTGALRDAIGMIAQQGVRNALVLTDENLRGLDAWTLLCSVLDEKGIAYTVFSAIEPNPTVATVASAFAVFETKRPDVLIALGGGSVIDTAKAVRLLSANPGPIENYEGVHHELKAGVKLVAIATTSGTAAEVTSNAVITDTKRHVKMVIISHATIPEIAVNDPFVLKSMPPKVTASTGMDALTHAIEAYVSKGAHTLTDHSALEAIRTITRWLPAAYDNGQDLQAREMMAHGQFLAWRLTAQASVACTLWRISRVRHTIFLTEFAMRFCCRWLNSLIVKQPSSVLLRSRKRWVWTPAH